MGDVDSDTSSSSVESDPELPPDGEPLVPEKKAIERHDKVSTSYTIFLIVMTIVFLAIAIVFGVNTYFYDKIRKNGCSPNISSSEAEALYWTNLILAVISGIMFIVCIILMFTTTKAPEIANRYFHWQDGTLAARARERWNQYYLQAQKYFGDAYGSAKKYAGAAALAAQRGREGLVGGAQSGWVSGINQQQD